MWTEMETAATIIGAEVTLCEEVPMVRRERWEEIRRLWVTERVPIAKIARHLDLDRKTVRRCVRDTAWQPYRRAARPETLLTAHAEYLRERAEQVDYSAQILFQELRQRGYQGSYETVKLFVRPLRALRLAAERALIRFETPPGQQSLRSMEHACSHPRQASRRPVAAWQHPESVWASRQLAEVRRLRGDYGERPPYEGGLRADERQEGRSPPRRLLHTLD
jgi:hypothetical protein